MATVNFTQEEYEVGEGEGLVRVCLSLDTPIATPLTVYIEAFQSTAIGMFISCTNSYINDDGISWIRLVLGGGATIGGWRV